MSFEQFPDTFYVKMLNNGLIERIGSLSLQDHSLELRHIVLSVLRVGVVTAERMRLHLYLDSVLARGVFASSDWRNLSDLAGGGSNNFGTLRFDFGRQYLNQSTTYYLGVETSGYTRTPAAYIGVKLDWPDDVYDALSAITRGAQMRVIGYRARGV